MTSHYLRALQAAILASGDSLQPTIRKQFS